MWQLTVSIFARISTRIGLYSIASATVVVATIVVAASSMFQSQTYSTEAGEWRTTTWRDSTITRMGPLTTLDVRLDTGQRSVEQRECAGEASFEVAKDPNRPFIVQCGNVSVRAIGTKFGISSHSQVTEVTVEEGSVLISRRIAHPNQPASVESVRAKAGEQVQLDPHTPLIARPVDHADHELAWERARVIFPGTRVEEAIGEFNRRHARQIAMPNYSFLVFGEFELDNPEKFVQFLEKMQRREQPK